MNVESGDKKWKQKRLLLTGLGQTLELLYVYKKEIRLTDE